jgi:hypothetical protein
MKNLLRNSLLVLATLVVVSACEDNTYEIPTTYDAFENVSYSGQTQRLAMLTEMTNYLKTSNTSGVVLDADKLKAMYANDAANAGFIGTYDASKQLKSKTLENQQTTFEGLMDAIEMASQSTVAAADGTAGVSTSADGEKNYLLNERGVEYTQLIEKGLMGACFYYQATAVYFGSGKMDVDNETVEPGEGTDMEHHWDEAFGYWGVPQNFPSSTDGLAFWGKYSNTVDAVLGTNQKLMDAFLKGRAAITNKDLETRDEAIIEARAEWEHVVAGTAIHYFNDGLENTGDFTRRAHALSEAIAFVYSLQFNPEKSMTNDQVNEILTAFTGSSDFTAMNLYNTTDADIQAAKNLLAGYMGWDATTADAL